MNNKIEELEREIDSRWARLKEGSNFPYKYLKKNERNIILQLEAQLKGYKEGYEDGCKKVSSEQSEENKNE